MKTLSLEEIKALEPCWLKTAEGREKFRRIGEQQETWTAEDVLKLPKEEVSSQDKLWLVLREDFLSARTLHLFACEVAEQALGKIENPDPRSIEAIRVKRLWIDGKATTEELDAAEAASLAAALAASRAAALDAALAASRAASRDAAWAAAWAAARDASRAASRDEQVQILLRLIEKEEKD